MKQSCRWGAALLALSLALPLAAAEFRGLEREMSPEDRARTGVDRLSTEQRAALDAWLQQRLAAAAPAMPASAPSDAPAASPADAAQSATVAARVALNDPSQIGFAHYSGERVEYTTRISGRFHGWTGRTLFRLDNGQVWQQSESGSYELTLDNPEVRMRPKALGSWMLVLKYNNRGVRVRRVE
ncbi:MAG: hypothetical protein MUE46_08790 [Xanthomonadales bacterium]|jgi:hypothetical protein|nr:hypothetical protein [Xanthomonadales bacterium]